MVAYSRQPLEARALSIRTSRAGASIARAAAMRSSISRRDFLAGTGSAAVVVGVAGCAVGHDLESDSFLEDPAPPPSNVDPADCHLTQANIEGPFHRVGAPGRTLLAPVDEPGERLVISGRVLGPDCVTPVTGALLDVWQASSTGRYDNDDPASPPAFNAYRLRGQMLTDENGQYQYDTIVPGRYLNGAQYRPAHIHYTISRPGFRSLTTQLYFAGDPFIDVDPFVLPSLVITLQRIDVTLPAPTTSWRGVFDIVLRRS